MSFFDVFLGAVSGGAAEGLRQHQEEITMKRKASLAQLNQRRDPKALAAPGNVESLVNFATSIGEEDLAASLMARARREGADVALQSPEARALQSAYEDRIKETGTIGSGIRGDRAADEGSSDVIRSRTKTADRVLGEVHFGEALDERMAAEARDRVDLPAFLGGQEGRQRGAANVAQAREELSGGLPEYAGQARVIEEAATLGAEQALNIPQRRAESERAGLAARSDLGIPGLTGRQAAEQTAGELGGAIDLDLPGLERALADMDVSPTAIANSLISNVGMDNARRASQLQDLLDEVGPTAFLEQPEVQNIMAAYEQDMLNQLDSELSLSEAAGAQEGREHLARAATIGESPVGGITQGFFDPRTGQYTNVRRDSTEADRLIAGGWVPTDERVQTIDPDTGRVTVNYQGTTLVMNQGKLVPINQFFGDPEDAVYGATTSSTQVVADDTVDDFVLDARMSEDSEVLEERFFQTRERIDRAVQEAAPVIRDLGYLQVSLDNIPESDLVAAGTGPHRSLVGRALSRIPYFRMGDNERQAMFLLRQLNIANTKLQVLNPTRPNMFDQVRASALSPSFGFLSNENQLYGDLRNLRNAHLESLRDEEAILRDPSRTVARQQEAREAIDLHNKTIRATEIMMLSRDLHTTTIPIGGRDRRLADLSANSIEQIRDYFGRYVQEHGQLPPGVDDRTISLMQLRHQQLLLGGQ